MHISILLMEQIIELFIMILMGFIIVKAGIVKDEDSKVLSKIVLYLIIPCVIINAFQVDYTSKTVRGLTILLATAAEMQVPIITDTTSPTIRKTKGICKGDRKCRHLFMPIIINPVRSPAHIIIINTAETMLAFMV